MTENFSFDPATDNPENKGVSGLIPADPGHPTQDESDPNAADLKNPGATKSDKSLEADRADSAAALANPPVGGGKNAEQTNEELLEDKHERLKDHTAHYLHGQRVLVTDAQKAEYDAKLAELNNIQGDRSIGDIPTSEPYWGKKAELDSYVAGLRR